MASICTLALFTVAVMMVLLPTPMVSSDFLAPLLSPVMSNFCKQVGCGKGTCKIPENTAFQYECECDPGWKQSLFSNASSLKFLPCVIPNCTINYSCSEAAAPSPSQETPLNASIFEPCNWAECGGGVCNKTSPLTYTCECKEGYNNLMNNTAFPCFKECSFGGDCSKLGITVSNNTAPAPKQCSIGGDCSNLGITVSNNTTPAPNLADTGNNTSGSIQRKAFYKMMVLPISIILAL